MGTKNNRRLINLSEMFSDLGEEYCESLLGLHLFTGDDTNCAFKGKGKLIPLKKMTKNEVPKDLSTDGQHAPFKRNPYSRIRNIHLLSVWLSEEKTSMKLEPSYLEKWLE